jgi:hypothetical protein
MEWEKKVEMVQYLNQDDEKALDIVIENIDSMDEQAWDMFFTGLSLTQEYIEKCIDKHKIIYHKAKDLQSDSFRTAMRMARYDQLIEQFL